MWIGRWEQSPRDTCNRTMTPTSSDMLNSKNISTSWQATWSQITIFQHSVMKFRGQKLLFIMCKINWEYQYPHDFSVHDFREAGLWFKVSTNHPHSREDKKQEKMGCPRDAKPLGSLPLGPCSRKTGWL